MKYTKRNRIIINKFVEIERENLILKYLSYNLLIPNRLRELFYKRLVTNSIHKTRIKKRCILSGRGRGFIRYANVSRIKFRQLASNGNIYGIKKSH